MTTPSDIGRDKAKGAHEIVTLLRSTIATQRLPYQHGTEERALGSLYDLFKAARKIMEVHADDGLSASISKMLNGTLRPFTARWHVLGENGALKSRDGGDAFRGELQVLQRELRDYLRKFHRMAYGSEWQESDDETPPALREEDLSFLREDLAHGIPEDAAANGGISKGGAAAINGAERPDIEERRKRVGAGGADGCNAIGLAFSGGGIRSGTFCLGVAQVLADNGLIRGVDYLSTVSGGGYTGGFLSRRYGDGATPAELGGAKGPDPEAIRFLRLRAKYLAAGSFAEGWGMVCATVTGMVMNWMVPLLVVTVAALLTMLVKNKASGESGWLIALCVFGGLTFVSTLVYFFTLRASRESASVAGWCLGFSVGLLVLVPVFWLLDLGFDWVFANTDSPWKNWAAFASAFHESPIVNWVRELGGVSKTTGLVAAIAAFVPVVLRFVPVLRSAKGRKVVNLVSLWIAGIVVPLLGVLAYYALCAVGRIDVAGVFPGWVPGLGGHAFSGVELLGGAVIVLVVLAIFFLDINLTAPFRLYRNGIGKTFVDVAEDGEGPGRSRNPADGRGGHVLLEDLNPSKEGPYHLINCAVNLPSSRSLKLRERKSDFFLFSKRWSGSPVIGYERTENWRMSRKEPDLASAMAISGAAFSSHMGLGSIPPLRALLTFLNVRLGYWIHQPGNKKDFWTDNLSHPGFSCLLREMTGLRMSEKQQWINLSDGGHIENLATYELLRRRCKFIVCVDGEADPEITFHGFTTLVRHAQIDLGVRIDADLEQIRPDPETGLSRSHYQLCRVHYPASRDEGRSAGTGLLLYLKLSVTGNESELIKRYRGTHPDFPHQTTLDQFFDEEQFEAYRQLGAHVAEGLFAPCLMSCDAESRGTAPASIPDWFERLAENLLERDVGRGAGTIAARGS